MTLGILILIALILAMGWTSLQIVFIITCSLLGFFKTEEGVVWNPFAAMLWWIGVSSPFIVWSLIS